MLKKDEDLKLEGNYHACITKMYYFTSILLPCKNCTLVPSFFSEELHITCVSVRLYFDIFLGDDCLNSGLHSFELIEG